MSLRDDLNVWTPRLRRYARALCSGIPDCAEIADDIVHAALLRTLKEDAARASTDLGACLYAAVTDAHREHVRRAEVQAGRQSASGDYEPVRRRAGLDPRFRVGPPPDGIVAGLAALRLGDREALLLVALEQCGYGRTMRILKITRAELIIRLTRARLSLGKSLGLGGEARGVARGHLRVVK